MIFTSLKFLVFYALLVSLLIVIKGHKPREILLLISSYVFYAAWNPVFIILIIVSSVWGWGLGHLMHRSASKKRQKLYTTISLVLSLGMLAYFKYANFFVENLGTLFGVQWQYTDIVLPVGISFFTFQTMSYTIDLYRGKITVCHSLSRFMLFVAFFPQLVAGPIVRASEFLPQLDRHITLKARDFFIGGQIFLGGAIQKVLVADNLSVLVDPVFSSPALYSSMTLWLALLAYGGQIFCDFSGYSLMAIGIARTMGYELPKNFNMPYLSLSITEFWRRWHLTLSFWLRDYLYISLGGNRGGKIRTLINLMITMLLGGLWHGASWNFVLWGALHGVALVVHKLWTEATTSWQSLRENYLYKVCAWFITLLFVLLLWVPFRAADFTTTITYIARLFQPSAGVLWLHPMVITVLIFVTLWHLGHRLQNRLLLSFPTETPLATKPSAIILVFLMLILMFAPTNTSPFIYFQF